METLQTLTNEIRRLEKVVLDEARYCFEWAAHYRTSNPDRAERHHARGMRLLEAVLPDDAEHAVAREQIINHPEKL